MSQLEGIEKEESPQSVVGKMIEVKNLKKTFGQNEVLKDINVTVKPQEVVVVIGPSGSGKSTFLRCINLLESITAGHVLIEGIDITDKKTDINKIRTEVGMVFQQFNLFPHMTVIDNVTMAPMQIRKMGRPEAEALGHELLKKVGLDSKAYNYPEQLSGGQQQRVALARALIVRPKVLLLDEPLSALDAQIRKKLQTDLRAIQRKLSMTMILVTHDQEEAMAVSDRIFVMNNGSIAQSGTPTEIYTRPENEFIANFIGHYNVFMRQDLEQMLGEPLSEQYSKFAIRPEALHFDKKNNDMCLTGKAKQSLMSGNIIRTTFEGETLFTMEQLHQQGYSIEMGKTYKCYVAKEDVIALS